MALPTNISYGTVVGQFLASVADGSDVDTLPDGVPMTGTIMFMASAGYVLDYSASPNPVTIVKTPIICSLDSNGYLCGPYVAYGGNPTPGVSLIATDDPDLQPVGWNWTVIYSLKDPLGVRVNLPTQSINVPAGTTVDLTTAMNIASSGGVIITKGDPNTLAIGTVSTLATGASATAAITGTAPNQTLSLGLPTGAVGPANTLAIGTVSTLATGASATAAITGTAPNQTLSLGLPTGAVGPANTLMVGSVTNGPNASVVISGTAPNQRIDFVLPQTSADQMALQIAMATAF